LAGFSAANLLETALGNTSDFGIPAVGAAFGAISGFASGDPVSAAADAAFAHSCLRNSFQPVVLPAACAALYLALHSFIETACAGTPPASRTIAAASAGNRCLNSRPTMLFNSQSYEKRYSIKGILKTGNELNLPDFALRHHRTPLITSSESLRLPVVQTSIEG